MSEVNQREEAIFEAALKLPADQRNAYLSEACTGDQALRQRIGALLGAFDRATGFMNEPATPVRSTSETSVSEKPGDWIGRYKLLEQIGEGGCGVVYVAEQEQPVRRRVALKIIKLGMDTKQVIARFDAERQALAMMDHPNIAKVFDAGSTENPLTPTLSPKGGEGGRRPGEGNSQASTLNPQLFPGRPYFVMELVRGVKITEYCEQNHLAPRERLDLFIQVCRAIQHAHQKGVIHRDIKPSNVLVASDDGVPVPKVIDFGIAKATQGRLTDQTVYTAFEQFIGTPAYMSPEQAALTMQDIDTRSDIYSLGVLLYELLTGTTPFDAKELLAKGLDEMRRTIREVEPVKPSTRLTQAAKSEIRNPKSEMDSALRTPHSAIPSDLDWIVMKCLEKDRTRRYETANGLSTDIQRHLDNEPIVARPPSQLYRFQKTVQRNKLAVSAATAVALALLVGLVMSMTMFFKVEAEKKIAEAEKKKAQIEATKSEQVAKFMTEMLEGAGPSVALGRDATLLREILDKTAIRIDNELTNQPEVQGDLWYTLGIAYGDIGDRHKPTEMYAKAVKCFRQCFPQGHVKLALALGCLGACQSGQNMREATNNAGLGLAMARRLKDEQTIAMCLMKYANCFKIEGKSTPEELPYIQEALSISRKFGTNKVYVWMLANLVPLITNNVERVSLAREALAAELALARGGDSPTVAYRRFILGQVLVVAGQPIEAESELRKALKLWGQYYASDQTHREFVFFYLIAALAQQEKWDDAEEAFQLEAQVKPLNQDQVTLRAAIQVQRGDWATAVKILASVVPALSNGTNNLTTTVLAFEGDIPNYHEYSRQILEQTPVGPDYVKMEWAARATLLLPPKDDNLRRAAELADAVSQVRDDRRFAPWAGMTKSLAEYRRGNFDAALQWSTSSLLATNLAFACLATDEFIQALAYGKLGQSSQAQKAFGAGNEALRLFRFGTGDNDGVFRQRSQLKESWHLQDWVSVEVLRREAASLLQASDPKQGVRQ